MATFERNFKTARSDLLIDCLFDDHHQPNSTMAASARHWLMLVCAAAVATMLIAMGLLRSSSPRWHVSQEQEEEEEAVHAARHDTSVAAVEQPVAEDPLTPSLAPSTLPPVLVASKSSVATPAAPTLPTLPTLPTPSTPPAATIAAAATTSTNTHTSTPRRPPWSLTLPEWMKHRPYLPPPLNATAPKLTKVQPRYHHHS